MIENTKISEHAVTTESLSIPPAVQSSNDTGSSVHNDTTRSNGRYNTAAFKRHAIKVSIETRNGKFSRVSESFTENLEALIEAKIIELRRDVKSFTEKTVEVEDNFLTGEGRKRVIDAFNKWIGETIHRVTKDQKTGKTLL